MVNNQAETVAALVERVDGIRRTGWQIAAVYAAIFCGFLTWYLPRELDRARSDFRDDINNVSKLQLDKLSAELSATKKSGSLLDAHDVQKLGDDVFAFVDSKNAGVSNRAWKTVNEVVGYYSLVQPVDPAFVAYLKKYGATLVANKPTDPCPGAPQTGTGLHVEGFIIENCTLRLNDLAERDIKLKNVLFRHVRVIYEKGTVSFNRVGFVDCTFEIALSPAGRRMGQTLLASNDVTNPDFP